MSPDVSVLKATRPMEGEGSVRRLEGEAAPCLTIIVVEISLVKLRPLAIEARAIYVDVTAEREGCHQRIAP